MKLDGGHKSLRHGRSMPGVRLGYPSRSMGRRTRLLPDGLASGHNRSVCPPERTQEHRNRIISAASV